MVRVDEDPGLDLGCCIRVIGDGTCVPETLAGATLVLHDAMVEVLRPSILIMPLALHRLDQVAKVVNRDAEARADIYDAGIRHTAVLFREQPAVKTVWLFRLLPCRARVEGPAAKAEFPAIVLQATEESHASFFLHAAVLAQNRSLRSQELVDV